MMIRAQTIDRNYNASALSTRFNSIYVLNYMYIEDEKKLKKLIITLSSISHDIIFNIN